MADIILEARELAKHFGGLCAVDGVSLQVANRFAAFDHRPKRRGQDHVIQPA